MRSKPKSRQTIGVLLSLLVLAFHYSPQMSALRDMPDTLELRAGQQHTLSLSWPLTARIEYADDLVDESGVQVLSSTDETLATRGVQLAASEQGSATLAIEVMGVPLREVALKVAPERTLVPGGMSIGIALVTQGVLVVGTSDIADTGSPARLAGIKPGDVIETVGGVRIDSAEHLAQLVNETMGETVTLQVMRKQQPQSVEVKPAMDAVDGKYRLGIWVRDSTAGVGTLSFYDPATQKYGALGHAITDIDTGSVLTVKDGRVLYSNIVDIQKGVRGQPGELRGSFLREQRVLGDITRNNNYGIYGMTYELPKNDVYPDGLPVGSQSGVHTGKATILTTLGPEGVKEYDIEITRVNRQTAPSTKSMTLRVTDPELLAKTGGIVQGMSGSPIIQDGRIIGAVTHVYVNDPTQGYGLFIEWMLTNADAA